MAIIINQPYIETVEGGKVRLCSRIEGSLNNVLYYEVDEKYAQYLCDDRADAFLLGLLNCAMYQDEEIICCTGVTNELLFQLTTFYMPILAKNNPELHNVRIQAQAAPAPEYSGTAVVTGNSGGVDALYSALRFSKDNAGKQGITHLIFNNISTADHDETRIRTLFERDVPRKAAIAADLGVDFVALYSNLYAFYKARGLFNKYYAAQYASAVYALAKLFGVFYFSSAYPVEEFSLSMSVVNKTHGTACYDLFSLFCLSSDHLRIVSAGMEATRDEKVAYIATHPVAQNHLQVCAIEQDAGVEVQLNKLNCGNCGKCQRTILQLYANGNLDAFDQVFDLSYFKKNTGKYMGRGLAGDQPAFSRHLKKHLKAANKLPRNEWIWEVLYRIRYFLSKNKMLVRFYYKLKRK